MSRLLEWPSTRRAATRGRGAVLVYTSVTLVVFCGFCVLAVDWGRVQVAKTEMVRATDAAARAAAAQLPQDPAAARAAAVLYASYNTVDGQPLALQPQDVVLGRWDPSTGALDTTAPNPDSVRIVGVRTRARGNPVPLSFGPVFGLQPADLTVVAAAVGRPGWAGGIVGYNGISVHVNNTVASYRSSQTTNPTTGTASRNGAIGSNGAIDGHNNDDLYNDAYLGPSGTISGIAVHGATRTQSSPLVPPPQAAWSPGSNPGGVPLAYSAGGGTTTLAGGTYWFTSLTVGSTLTFAGPATVYVKGPVSLGTLRAYNGVPANLKIYQIGSYPFGGGNGVDITADIQAPASDFDVQNNLVFRGRMLFNTITIQNNAELYYDEDLGPADGSSTVSTVQ